MAKKFRRFGAMLMALVMCVSVLGMTVSADVTEIKLENGNIWNSVSTDIPSAPEGYPYVLFSAPNDGIHYYETSHHTVQLTGGGAVHVMALVDSRNVDENPWTPTVGEFDYGVSNYDIVYCCDAATGTVDFNCYQRINLEDSEYFTEEEAQQLRAIMTNAYPFLSVPEAKAALKEAGFGQADELDRSELISATQAAVWIIANKDSGDTYRYVKTAPTGRKNTWGGYLYNFSPEITNFKDSTSVKYLTNPNGVGDRVNALIDFYLYDLDGKEAEDNQIVISKFAFVGKPVAVNDDEFTAELEIVLNRGVHGDHNAVITVTAGDQEIIVPVVAGQTNYNIPITANCNDEIRAVVSGTQELVRGVYFYAPQPKDVDGDGIATSREVSQNLIGVADGETPIYSEAVLTVEFEEVDFNSGDVSNISYMFLDKATGAVEFIKKIDIDDGITSVPVLTMDGYVSVMFMKQATSGMFWFSEDVSEEQVNAAIECLKDNNPSYKGYNAICFGEGDHTLEFKSGKFVTYTFNAGAACDCDCGIPAEDPTVPENETPETPEDDTTVTPEDDTTVTPEDDTTETPEDDAELTDKKAQKEAEKAEKKAEKEAKKEEKKKNK